MFVILQTFVVASSRIVISTSSFTPVLIEYWGEISARLNIKSNVISILVEIIYFVKERVGTFLFLRLVG